MRELGFYGFPVFLAAHHHPTYEPKTITTGRCYLGELAAAGLEVQGKEGWAQALTGFVTSDL